MATRYYSKEMPEQAVYVNGVPLRFEILETSDPTLIAELDNCIAKSRGGVIAISAETYAAESKKKENGSLSESDLRHKRQRQELSALQLNPHHAAVEGFQANGMFAKAQEREHKPHNQFGLPKAGVGPSGGGAMPDPIEIPAAKDFVPPKPATAKFSAVEAVK